MKFILFNIFALLSILTTGCVSSNSKHYIVSVNAISSGTNQNAQQAACFILPGDEKTPRDSLEFREYASFVAKGLIEKGYSIYESPQQANIAIFVSYAISDKKQETITTAMPVYGPTGYSSATTQGRIDPYLGTYQSTTQYNQRYGVKGYTPVQNTYTFFTRAIVIDAMEISRETGEPKIGKQLWRVTATSNGPSADLRRVIPYMVTASKTHFGGNTGKAVEMTVYEEDPEAIAFTGFQPEK